MNFKESFFRKIPPSRLPTPEFKQIRQEFSEKHLQTISTPENITRDQRKQFQKDIQERLQKTRSAFKSNFWKEHEERSQINKYEREQLRKLLIEVKQKSSYPLTGERITIRKKFREEIRNYTMKLDALNVALPIYNSDIAEMPRGAQLIEIETPHTGRVGIRAVTLDVRSEEDKSTSQEIPAVFLTGWSADYKSPAAYTQTLALTSNRPVVTLSMPEHYTSTRPYDWSEKLTATGNNSLHAEVFIAAIKELGLKTIDLSGFSAGGSMALTMAQYLNTHPDMGIEIRNLDVFNATGFQDKRFSKLMSDFIIKNGLQALPDKSLRRRATIVQRNWKDFRGTGSFVLAREIMTKQHFSPENLASMKTLGTIKIFLGDQDPISPYSDAKKIIEQILQPHSIRLVKVQGGNHGMLLSKAAYFANTIGKNQEIPSIIKAKNIPGTLAELLREKYNSLFF